MDWNWIKWRILQYYQKKTDKPKQQLSIITNASLQIQKKLWKNFHNYGTNSIIYGNNSTITRKRRCQMATYKYRHTKIKAQIINNKCLNNLCLAKNKCARYSTQATQDERNNYRLIYMQFCPLFIQKNKQNKTKSEHQLYKQQF